MRAKRPDQQGDIVRDGVRVHWEVYGAGDRTVFLLPAWSIVHSRHWKFQIAYLARHCRVLVMDGRGNGLSDRPLDPDAYADEEYAADALAVMDATSTASAAVVSLSAGGRWALMLAARHPERVTRLVFIAPAVHLEPWKLLRGALKATFEDIREEYDDYQKFNANYWLKDHRGFLEFFFGLMFPELHSTKQIEDAVNWGLESTPQVLVATERASMLEEAESVELAEAISCPVLVIHGDEDAIVLHANGEALAELTHGRLLTMEGSGHGPHLRDPVAVNLTLRDFLLPSAPARAWRRAPTRRRRAVYVSSPIGLGHARRDVAIARELRQLVPNIEIEWLAQDPVTRFLEANGETIHPASRLLASESGHIEHESSSHRLHVFEAWRRMDEILLSNFMVFLEAVTESEYDLWIGDEAWEVDHYLHENPELKRAAYVWLTDFVGWLPMPSHGERDVILTADYNAEMIEHVERYPWVRDLAIFIGRRQDVVPGRFGPQLPEMPAWTDEHYEFSGGYIFGHNQPTTADREVLRRRFGFEDGETVCIASVGGSGVGTELLSKLMQAFPAAQLRIPGLRMIAVAGPRVDVRTLPAVEGVEVHGFVPELNLQLAACDIALTQGGLSTTMELTAAKRPF
ncbi:MAG TPA: alpha/beta fold hydrolase, partial [Candidatus Dormibacteraeota bacterium]|nr:alpha/beta fold hydrolase [Candidatus Dormibacteraeota bacterium]